MRSGFQRGGRSAEDAAELLAAGMIAADAAGSAGYANSAWTTMTSQGAADWRGQGWFDVIDEADRSAQREALLTTIALGTTHEALWPMTDVEQSPRVLRVVAVPDFAHGAVRGLVATCWDVTEERARTERLFYLATHDQLTGLYNRGQFLEFVRHALDRQRRRPDGLAVVLMIDVDGFKAINDRLGHEAGDRLLRTLAARISSAVRPTDIVARYGGDEFTVLCEDVRDAAEASSIIERIRAAAQSSADGDEPLSLSTGMGYVDDPDLDPAALIERADLGMYRNKRAAHAGSTSSRPATAMPDPGAGHLAKGHAQPDHRVKPGL